MCCTLAHKAIIFACNEKIFAMKKILGLDLGTNSIGWAIVNEDETSDVQSLVSIEAAGSRIIPMSADQLGEFEKGNTVSQTRERTSYRSTRRLRERFLLRRERLHRVLKLMGFLPQHYDSSIDEYGRFHKGLEPKLEWRKNDDGKFEFIFQKSFDMMLESFRNQHPEVSANRKVPADWTLYYLRKKALTEKISKEEIAWILLNFNQKRGYYQLRGEDDDMDLTKREEYMKLDVLDVEDSGDRKGKSVWYNVKLSNGLVYRRASEQYPDWAGKSKEFIVTTQLENDGSIKMDKDGYPKISIRAPKDDDWNLLKKRTENDIEKSGKTVGEFIFDSILTNPDIKIIGKLVRTIERKFYRNELKQILRKQAEFHSELKDPELYRSCVTNLYNNNEAYRNSIESKDFIYLLSDDIIFYQRPLKSKKHLINNCPYETRYYADSQTGVLKNSPVKCIAKSNPMFQEFRLWQFISNLRLYSNNGYNTDVTALYLETSEDRARLFEWLDERKEIDQMTLLTKYFGLKKAGESLPVRWNYVEDKKYPCNKTRAAIASRLETEELKSLSPERMFMLWHLLYSTKTKEEIDAALNDSKKGQGGVYDKLIEFLSEKTISKLKSVKFEEDDYGAYSEKAIKKLLPLMRQGKYWSTDNIEGCVKGRIEKLLSGEYDENIDNRTRDKVASLHEIADFQGLPLWLACYIVYGRHSEKGDTQKWKCPTDIDKYLAEFKQHSLRNPIVEQVITETLRTVRDIWTRVGRIDEIHIELGRELKSTNEQRARITRMNAENENTNQRIKVLLQEFMDPDYNVESVRPYSPIQQEVLKIYEEGAILNSAGVNDEINDIVVRLSHTETGKRPSKSDVIKYKTWLEQNYRSPYTGQPIPLAKLFTHEYEIEHIIPQSRYFDDSFQNKVICEAEVNRLKDKQLGYEFIKSHHGEVVTLTGGRTVTILSVEAYEAFVKKTYGNNRGKMQKLLLEDIPDEFINRQLNDTRYISKYITSLLSNIVREEVRPGEYESEAISKNLIVCNGSITTRLKQDWGLNDVWNSIILPRFIRMNTICNTTSFTSHNQEGHLIPSMPDEYSKGFNKKRIDHRHHALDAIVIACATRSHVHLLNNEAARSDNKEIRHQLSRKLRRYEKVIIDGKGREIAKEFLKPWSTFTQDVKTAIETIVVSFKQNLRVINKATNIYTSYRDEQGNLRLDKNGKPVKGQVAQKDNPGWWAIRKPLHKDTVFAKVALRDKRSARLSVALQNPDAIVERDLRNEIKKLLSSGYDEKSIKKYFLDGDNKDIWAEFNPGKIEVYYFTDDTYAVRKALDESFGEKQISAVTDTGIQKILRKHLKENSNNPKVAFSPEGIEKMNADLQRLNGGKKHHPIYKVRVYEHANKFAIGEKGNKKDKYVEAAKGTNLYFAVYANSDGTRSFDTIALNVVIDRLKNGLSPVPETDEARNRLLFYLSPNDLVYIPTEEEIESGEIVIRNDRIYKMVSATGTQCCFINARVASTIVNIVEFSPLNKMERAISGEMIKSVCIPIKVDRLGKITDIGTKFLAKGLKNE